ncbi:MAG: hypothetical protein QM820_56990 [Minicystis sp.]
MAGTTNRARPHRPLLRARIARLLGCAIAEPDGDGIAHYLVDLRGAKPVDIRPPERWTARTLAHRLAVDVCDEDGRVSLSLHGARGEHLWVLTAMRVERLAAYEDGDERGFVMWFRELPGRLVEVSLAPTVSVRIAPRRA